MAEMSDRPCDNCRKVEYCNKSHCSKYKRWFKNNRYSLNNLAEAMGNLAESLKKKEKPDEKDV